MIDKKWLGRIMVFMFCLFVIPMAMTDNDMLSMVLGIGFLLTSVILVVLFEPRPTRRKFNCQICRDTGLFDEETFCHCQAGAELWERGKDMATQAHLEEGWMDDILAAMDLGDWPEYSPKP